MLNRSFLSGGLIALAALLALPTRAHAVTMQLELTPFTGTDSSVLIDLSDEGGIITGQVNVVANPNIGDLRALFLQVNDLSILNHLNITGDDITAVKIDAGKVTSIGNANVNGGGNPGPFDIGIAFGSPGIGFDDIRSTSFIIAHDSTDLFLDMFDLSNWAARLTSVGLAGGPREGSSKLRVTDIRLTGLTPPQPPLTPEDEPSDPGFPGSAQNAPIPEPGIAALIVVAGALGAGWWRRRLRIA